ncbi:UNVERIFIED_CONTAM: bifunctional folylpolyglutamate synthase/dihydrofolate synthase, partial [Salmonella enterica subsp. enterica serovar Weltevreden]
DNNPDVKNAIEEATDKYVNVLEKHKDSTYKLDFNTFSTNILINRNKYEYSLFGDYPYKNFLCAYEVVKYLGIAEYIINEAIKKVVWQCR